MDWGAGIVVEANTAEEAEELKEDILQKAALLRKFDLVEEPFTPQGDDEEENYFIVVKDELEKLDTESTLDEDAMLRLLDVPEAAGLTALPEDVVVIHQNDFPSLYSQIRAFLDSAEDSDSEEHSGEEGQEVSSCT
ncbi:unnamed protein product [Cladocopium goreaui]|uniref:Uncharacterized protein n=1 Tax=Cladocopium goreaui TaxID=2562237 RepID=A0A9P1C1P8_9DINO|nr:unnamed protein product [Cladocopium goreaui]